MTGRVVDLFAGGGGASLGIERALGRPVSVAVNHDHVAIAVHRANHPATRHLEASVWEVRPKDVVNGDPVDLLWASPDCTHFSRAKGGVPRSRGIRSLAWVVVRWAKAVRPRVICLENVREFSTWGPLGPDGRPCKRRAGQTYDEWVHALERLGYTVESRLLDASRYGAPTKRSRLFVVARRDGEPIRWPEPTHGPGREPLRTAAECIDWSIPCASIFDRKRPLAPATLRRVAEGVRRFVLEAAEPFVVRVNHSDPSFRGQGLGEPLSTVTATRRSRAVVTPAMVSLRGTSEAHLRSSSDAVDEPLRTISAGGTHHAVVSPSLIQQGYGERAGQSPRVLDLHEPLGTVVAGGNKHGLVSAFLARHYGGGRKNLSLDLRGPTGTVTAKDHHGLVAASLAKFYGTGTGQAADEPLHTVTAKARFALVAAFLEEHGIHCPEEVATVHVGGTTYAIADIGLRMLEPHELLRAQFGDYAEGYDMSAATTKAAKIRLIGNSVCPHVAEALVSANLAGWAAMPTERQEVLFTPAPGKGD